MNRYWQCLAGDFWYSMPWISSLVQIRVEGVWRLNRISLYAQDWQYCISASSRNSVLPLHKMLSIFAHVQVRISDAYRMKLKQSPFQVTSRRSCNYQKAHLINQNMYSLLPRYAFTNFFFNWNATLFAQVYNSRLPVWFVVSNCIPWLKVQDQV